MRVAGVDVGAAFLHCVVLDAKARVIDAVVFETEAISSFVEWSRAIQRVAVDAPAELSTAPHAEDVSLSPKFRAARCAEIALGRERGIWVPWVAPAGDPSGWIATGLEVFRALRDACVPVIETYPYAVFRVLAEERLPPKSRPAGIKARAKLLRQAGVEEASLELWSNDGLDALAAALVALRHQAGTAQPVGCGHDTSVIWLPAPA